MIKITGLTAEPFQNLTILEPNGTGGKIKVKLTYRSRTQNWYIDIDYKTFSLKGYQLTRDVNTFNKFKNIIPFGLFVSVADEFEPFLLNDFSTGRVTLFLLSSVEVSEIDRLVEQGYTLP